MITTIICFILILFETTKMIFLESGILIPYLSFVFIITEWFKFAERQVNIEMEEPMQGLLSYMELFQ